MIGARLAALEAPGRAAKLPHWLSSPCAYGVHVSRGLYRRTPHVELISDAFRRCALTPGGRLMIITPPRHGKSVTASHYGPAWYLSHFPERRVLFATYAANFAGSWGQRVRDSLLEHGRMVGVQITGRRARQDWTTSHKGGMRSIGAGSAAGLGAHLQIMDDTVPDSQAALSTTIQKGLWDWYLADYSTRREGPDTSLVAIGTRWTENDLLGRLLKAYAEGPGAEGYEDWEILYLPAIYDGLDWTGRRAYEDPLGRKVGDALWPEQWSAEWLKKEQSAKPWWFAALYQGRPEPLEGGILKSKWWSYWRPPGQDTDELEPVVVDTVERPLLELPKLLRAYISVDCNFLADLDDLVKGRDPADVAIHVWGLGPKDELLFLLDRETSVMDLNQTVRGVLAMVERYRAGSPVAQALGLEQPPLVAIVEAKANGPAVMAQLRRRGVRCLPATPLTGKVDRVVSRGDTEAHRYGRATAMADDLLAGKLHLPHPGISVDGRGYNWSYDVRHKFAQFPRAGRDDTDAASQAHAKLTILGYAAEDAEVRAAARTEAKVKRLVGLPRSEPMPKTQQEMQAARARTIAAKLEKAAERRFNKPLRGGRVSARLNSPWGRRS